MEKILIFGFSFYELVLYFFIYAFLGWVSEVIFATLKTGKFVNRGFLNGPVCPIYGSGFLLVLICLHKFENKLILLFIMSILVTSLIEFLTGAILERVFHRKWWDYSSEPFNIKGYVCLRFSILWGLACLFILKIVHPGIRSLVNNINYKLGIVIIIAFSIILLVDLILTITEVSKLNLKFKELDVLNKKMRYLSDKVGSTISDATNFSYEKYNQLVDEIKKTRIAKAFINIKDNLKRIEKK